MHAKQCIVLLPLLVSQHFGALAGKGDPGPHTLTVELLGLDDPVLPSITPTISIRAFYVVDDPPPVALGVRASLSSLVLDRIILDTFVVATDSALIRLARPLPSGATVYFRSYARTAQGNEVLSFPSGPRLVPRWLTLVFPNAPAGAILDDPRPTFIWSSARVATPPGPWRYDFAVANTAGGPPIYSISTTDTSPGCPWSSAY